MRAKTACHPGQLLLVRKESVRIRCEVEAQKRRLLARAIGGCLYDATWRLPGLLIALLCMRDCIRWRSQWFMTRRCYMTVWGGLHFER